MIYGIVLGIHVLICLALVIVVLLQAAKGGGLAGGAFGGGAESTVFGGRGAATVLSKATTVFGAAFMISSLTLTLMSVGRETGPRSVVAEEAARQAPLAPPGATAPPGTGDAGLPGAVPGPGDAGGTTVPPPEGEAPAPVEETPAPQAGTGTGG